MNINKLTTAKKVGISALIFIPTFYITTKTANKLLAPPRKEKETYLSIFSSTDNTNSSFWNNYWNDMTSSATAGTIGATVAGTSTYLGVPALASALGFGSGGVAAGTTAAGMMSAAGNVAAGSVVASLQSVGATGAVALGTTVLPIALVVGSSVGLGYYVWNVRKEDKNGKLNSEKKNNSSGIMGTIYNVSYGAYNQVYNGVSAAANSTWWKWSK